MRLSWNEHRARAAAFAGDWKDAAYEQGEMTVMSGGAHVVPYIRAKTDRRKFAFIDIFFCCPVALFAMSFPYFLQGEKRPRRFTELCESIPQWEGRLLQTWARWFVDCHCPGDNVPNLLCRFDKVLIGKVSITRRGPVPPMPERLADQRQVFSCHDGLTGCRVCACSC